MPNSQQPTANSRLEAYLAAIFTDWLRERAAAPFALSERRAAPTPVFVARTPDNRTAAIAVALLWDATADPAAEDARQMIPRAEDARQMPPRAEDARQMMEERLSAGNVRGPHLLWVPPRGAVPADEPAASDFVMRVQLAAAPLLPGARTEVDLPARVQLAKTRDEGGYASVIGGLSRWWTNITERVDGTYNVNAMQIRRAPRDESRRDAIINAIAERARGMQLGELREVDTYESWTVQRLREEPLGETGFAIAQAPPTVDPAEGTHVRRLLRQRLTDANAALAQTQADMKCVAIAGIYEFAEHENIGSFVKSLNPTLFAGLTALAAIVDAEVRPVFLAPHLRTPAPTEPA